MKCGFYLSLILIFSFTTLNAQINFVDRSSSLGINQPTGNSVFGGHGVSFIDFDNDGFDDITMGSGMNTPLRFYKNINGIFFAELDFLASLDYGERIRSVVWVDYDNDGDKDLFLTSDTSGNRLFENNNSTLVEVTEAAGFPPDNLSTYGASWGDIDNDGCLDVYLSNRIGGTAITNYLFKNNCDGTFSEVTDAVGLTNGPALTFCSGFFDFNNDGWQDLYVANDKFEPNFLYKNNGDGTFTDVSISSGSNVIIDAMSVTIDDYNSDGYLDIFMTNTPEDISTPLPGSLLLRNNGDETFTDVSESSGTSVNSFCWGSNFFDADNDKDLDLYVNSQYIGDNGFPSYAFFTNSANGTFSQPNDVGFTTNNHPSYASAIGDYNNDGLMEIIVNNDLNQLPSLWENIATNTNNFIAIKLLGTVSNKDGIGSTIEIAINNEKQYRYTMCGEGYLSQNSDKEIFGLGTSTTIDYVKVTWLSGIVDIIYDVDANQFLNIEEGSALSVKEPEPISFQYYPNPIENKLMLNSASGNIERIVMFNTLGQEVMQVQPNALASDLDMSTLQTGTYFVQVTIANETKTIRVLKQ